MDYYYKKYCITDELTISLWHVEVEEVIREHKEIEARYRKRNAIAVLATAPQKPSNHPGYNGLDKADTAIHNGPGLFSKPDVEFHTGTGQGGFCVSNVCTPR